MPSARESIRDFQDNYARRLLPNLTDYGTSMTADEAQDAYGDWQATGACLCAVYNEDLAAAYRGGVPGPLVSKHLATLRDQIAFTRRARASLRARMNRLSVAAGVRYATGYPAA